MDHDVGAAAKLQKMVDGSELASTPSGEREVLMRGLSGRLAV
jgi:hypothetical protein